MQIPVFRSNRLTQICHKCTLSFDGFMYKLVLKPALFVLPISFLLAITADSDIFSKVVTVFPTKLQNYLIESQLLLVAAVFTLMAVGNAVEGTIRYLSKPDSELTREDLHSILACIDEVVSGKRKRFLSLTRQALKDNWTPEKTFTEITQPKQQIALQVKAIHAFFEYFTQNKVQFRIGLMRIVGERPTGWATFFPEEHPPKATIDSLSSPTSTIMRSIEREDTVIVSDTSLELQKKNKEDRNFVGAGGQEKNGSRSILAYPIYCPNTKKPIYVLSILAKEKNCFEEKKADIYKWIIDHFLSRILIEHHLLLLKEGVDHEW